MRHFVLAPLRQSFAGTRRHGADPRATSRRQRLSFGHKKPDMVAGNPDRQPPVFRIKKLAARPALPFGQANFTPFVVGLTAVTFVAPTFAHSHNHARHAGSAAVGAPNSSGSAPTVIGSRRPGVATPTTVRGESKIAKVDQARTERACGGAGRIFQRGARVFRPLACPRDPSHHSGRGRGQITAHPNLGSRSASTTVATWRHWRHRSPRDPSSGSSPVWSAPS